MTRPAVDLLRELSALKQRTVEIERELGLGPADNASALPSIPSHEDIVRRLEEAEAHRLLRGSLKKALAEWHRTFDAVDWPIVVLDGEGVLLRLNAAAQRLAAHPLEHLQCQRLADLDLPAPWPQAADFLKTVLRDPTAISTRVEDPDTGRSWDLSISPDDTEPVEQARVILVLRSLAG
jgi:PAS domain-containing protein